MHLLKSLQSIMYSALTIVIERDYNIFNCEILLLLKYNWFKRKLEQISFPTYQKQTKRFTNYSIYISSSLSNLVDILYAEILTPAS